MEYMAMYLGLIVIVNSSPIPDKPALDTRIALNFDLETSPENGENLETAEFGWALKKLQYLFYKHFYPPQPAVVPAAVPAVYPVYPLYAANPVYTGYPVYVG